MIGAEHGRVLAERLAHQPLSRVEVARQPLGIREAGGGGQRRRVPGPEIVPVLSMCLGGQRQRVGEGTGSALRERQVDCLLQHQRMAVLEHVLADKTAQALLIEAINDLFAKHGLSRIAD